ncbi:MAG: formylglycine-generating enzyme family protein [Pirellulaceae bacterium]
MAATGYVTEAEADGRGGWGINDKWESSQKAEYTWHNGGFPQADDHPVGNVTWNDANAFCDWLSQVEGRTYRLPTEAEWEYACRATSTTTYYHGNDPDEIGRFANIFDLSAQRLFPRAEFANTNDGFPFSAPVGSFIPNSFGVFDMHGNVMEWCADWYEQYPSTSVTDPLGPADGLSRVHREAACITQYLTRVQHFEIKVFPVPHLQIWDSA